MRKEWLKKYSLFLLVFALAIVLNACSSTNNSSNDNSVDKGDNDEKTVIRFAWWGNDERHNLTQEVIELFEEKNPDISVKTEFTSWDSYWDRLTTQAAGDNLPDLVQMSNHRLNEYISRDLVLNLNDFIDNDIINLDDVSSVHQDMNIIDNNTYAVSGGSNALAIVYNMDLFEEYDIDLDPEYTYEDLIDLQTTIPDEDLYIISYETQDEHEIFQHFARQYGERLYDEDGQLGISTETLVDFMTNLRGLIDNGIAPPFDISLEARNIEASLVASEEVLMGSYGSNQLLFAQELATANLGLMPLPIAEGAVEPGDWIRPAMSFSIASTSGTAEQEAAAKLLDFITNDLEANKIMRAERGVPISSKVREGLYSDLDETSQKQFEFLELLEDRSGGREPLPPPGQQEVQAAFERMIEEVFLGDTTIEDGAESFFNEAEQILN